MVTLYWMPSREIIDFEDETTLTEANPMTFDDANDAFNYLYNDFANAINPTVYDAIDQNDEDAPMDVVDLARHIGDNDLGFDIVVCQ